MRNDSSPTYYEEMYSIYFDALANVNMNVQIANWFTYTVNWNLILFNLVPFEFWYRFDFAFKKYYCFAVQDQVTLLKVYPEFIENVAVCYNSIVANLLNSNYSNFYSLAGFTCGYDNNNPKGNFRYYASDLSVSVYDKGFLYNNLNVCNFWK